MTSRRTFLKNSAAGAAGLAVLPYCTPPKKELAIGLQLYTVRDQMKENVEGTLTKLANIGYQVLETAGYSDGKFYGYEPKMFKSLVEGLNMKAVSSHMAYQVFENEPEKAIGAMQESEQMYAVIPWLAEEDRQRIDQYKRLCESMNKWGELCKKAGIQLCYHNHAFEFDQVDGQIPFDVILAETDPELLKIEMDLYWVRRAGRTPLEYFESHPGRFLLWHVKDMDDTADQNFTEIGNGVIDFKKIFAEAKTSGMKHFFIEQDSSDDPMKSVAISYKNLKAMLS
ncbi:MAG: sugar phosphate isomerase/epimerase [Cyclobacteriaceae bacterium]|nr:sugar phosphate isomerase/epimerase [Cyclobacteriaceae bacterium HetDA_MAG_MS6]